MFKDVDIYNKLIKTGVNVSTGFREIKDVEECFVIEYQDYSSQFSDGKSHIQFSTVQILYFTSNPANKNKFNKFMANEFNASIISQFEDDYNYYIQVYQFQDYIEFTNSYELGD